MRDKNVIDIAEKALENYPDDIICNMAVIYLRKKFKYQSSSELAKKVLQDEIYCNNMNYWVKEVRNGLDILELARIEALKSFSEKSPFQRMKHISYTTPEAVPVLKEIAYDLHKIGEDEAALNQLRNAAMVDCLYGNGMSQGLCLELSIHCSRVKEDSFAAILASYASTILP